MEYNITSKNWLTEEGIEELKRYFRNLLTNNTKESNEFDDLLNEEMEKGEYYIGTIVTLHNITNYNDKALKIEYSKYCNCTGEEGNIEGDFVTYFNSFEDLEEILNVKGFFHNEELNEWIRL